MVREVYVEVKLLIIYTSIGVPYIREIFNIAAFGDQYDRGFKGVGCASKYLVRASDV
jgi:hypothetical protein